MYLRRLGVKLIDTNNLKRTYISQLRCFSAAVTDRLQAGPTSTGVNTAKCRCHSWPCTLSQRTICHGYTGHTCVPVRGQSTVTKPAVNNNNEQDLEQIFPLRFLFIRTSLDLWEDYPGGVQFDCGYVDSSLGSKGVLSRAPVILGLPSSVGTHKELTGVLMVLAKLGCRVIIPNLPDSELCRGVSRVDSTVFTHSTSERAGFIQDFLRELQITKVDMVISNSCSIYSAIHTAVNCKDLIQSMVFINPTSLHYTKQMLPVGYHKKFAFMWDDRFVLQPLMKLLLGVGKQLTKKRSWSASTVVMYSKFVNSLNLTGKSSVADTSFVMDASHLKAQAVPVFAIYGESNSQFDRASSEDYLELMGLPKSAVSVYDAEEKKFLSKGVAEGKNAGVFMQGQDADLTLWHKPFIRKTILNYVRTIKPDL